MTDVTFSEEQERAIDAIVKWYGNPDGPQEYYLAGYAGVGKSTVCAEAIDRICQTYKISNVVTGAYTGKAAHVLRKKGNPNATTIHAMIYTLSDNLMHEPPARPDETTDENWAKFLQEWEKAQKPHELKFVLNPLGTAANAKLIVLDECSMIDIVMANDLRSFGKKILVMGDPGQLPPVKGEGSFTSRAPDFFLKQIHRQAADSPIIELATMARQGIALPLNYKKGNVRVLPVSFENAQEMHDPDFQVLCGIHRIRWSVTQAIREGLGFTDRIPMPGERILCCKNDKDKGLFNGGMGILGRCDVTHEGAFKITGHVEETYQKEILTDSYLFRQHFDNGASQYDYKKKRMCFDWAYALTVHKFQGSSAKNVVLIDNSSSFKEQKWLHLYTGITRAEEGLTVLVDA